MPRAFIAIRLAAPSPTLLAVLRTLSHMGSAVKAIPPANLHITLRFLGDTEPASFDAIEKAIRHASAGVAPFAFHLTGLGAFPHQARPSVVWVGATGDATLHRIVAALNPAIDALHFGRDDGGRPWISHLTLARVKAKPPDSLRQLFDEHPRTDFGPFLVTTIDLMLSTLTKTGPIYAVERTVTL